MPSAAILPHETQVGWCYRRGKLAEECHDRLQVSSTLHHQAKGSRLATNSLCRQTLVRPSRIRRVDQDPHIPQPRELGRAPDHLGQGKTLVANDAESLQFHEGPPPRNRLGGDCRFVPALPLRERRQCHFSAPQFASVRRSCTRGAVASPGQQHGAQKSRDQTAYGWSQQRAKGSHIKCHQFFLGEGTPNDSWK